MYCAFTSMKLTYIMCFKALSVKQKLYCVTTRQKTVKRTLRAIQSYREYV